jgi:hypothetical protein
MGKKPRRMTVGNLISQTVMPSNMSPMQLKNTATGVVQAIHSNISIPFNQYGTELARCM